MNLEEIHILCPCSRLVPIRRMFVKASNCSGEIKEMQEIEISNGNREDSHFVAMLKACANKKDLHKGMLIHADILRSRVLEKSPYVASSLICMYAKCGVLTKAQQVLEELPIRSVVCWNALISGYIQQGNGQSALKCFKRMHSEGISPDVVTFICILKACGNTRSIDEGKEIHDEIVTRNLLKKHIILGTALVDMYAKCAMLVKAQDVLDELPERDAISWNALISGYVHKGQAQEALVCFQQMQREGLSPDNVTFICILKACGSMRSLEKGKQIHEMIVNRNILSKDIILGTALVDMYAKCGMLATSQLVLESLHVRDIIAWNALIAGYAHQGLNHEALSCYEQMQTEGLSPNAITFVCILKACGGAKVIKTGKLIHEEIVKRDLLGKEIVLGTALVDMYAKCGMLAKAQQLLKELPIRDAVSYNALIAGYAEWGKFLEALKCFESMQNEGVSPDAVTFICTLKVCGTTGSVEKGKQIHENIANRGLLNKDIGNALVDMYAKCGLLEKAQQVLWEFPVVDVVSCNSVILGYVQQGQDEKAMKCYAWMRTMGLSPDSVTFTWLLKACESIGAIEKGKEIHEEIVGGGFLEKDIVLGTALVDMYARCGVLDKAQHVLEELPMRDTVTWNTLIAGYANQEQCHEALECFGRMQSEGLLPDVVTYLSILKACGSSGAIDQGKKIHDVIVSKGLLKQDIVLGNALVDMYVKCGMLAKAQQVLNEIPVRDGVSWNTLIAGYARQGQCYEALKCFEQMQKEGISPYAVTYTCILMACGSIGALKKGKQIHREIMMSQDLLEDVVLGNALVDMYVKCGMLSTAQEVLEELPNRNIVSWSALIAGYAQQGQGHEALDCYERMQSEGICANVVTFICVLNACGCAGAIDMGKKIHEEIVIQGLLEKDIVLGNALVDMYAKCSMLVKARQILEELPIRNIISWNALISGYAEQGEGNEALNCFEKMQNEGISPNEITFLSVLSACSHAGLLDQAELLYTDMTKKYGITPSIEHHTCMLMILGSGGHFEKAMEVINVMPSCDNLQVWLVLLGACKKWGNVKLGRLTFDQIVQLDNSCSTAYVLISDILAAAGMHEDVEKINALRRKYATWKKQGKNLGVDTSGNVHAFSRKDIQHSLSKTMYTNEKTITCKMTSVMVTVS